MSTVLLSRQGSFSAAWLALLAISASQAQPTFQGIGTPGETFSWAYAISADATTVVGMVEMPPGVLHAFRWDAGTGFHSLGSTTGFALGVSADGSVIVGGMSVGSGPSHVFRWTAATGAVGLDPLIREMDGVSGDGETTAASWNGNGVWPEACRWFGGATVGLGDLAGGAFSSEAHGISADGSVIIGDRQSANGFEAFRWDQSGMIGLGSLPNRPFESVAMAASADGSVIVGGSPLPGEAFRWTAETGMVSLGVGTYNAYAVSADGATIPLAFNSDGFVWTQQHGLRRLRDVLRLQDPTSQIAAWGALTPSAISADGRVIAGTGTNPSGQGEAWIARIPLGVPSACCAGDLNCDNIIDLRDLTLFLSRFGSCDTFGLPWADFDGGCVGLSDLTLLLTRFGATCP